MGFKKYVFFAFFLDFYITLNLHMRVLRTKSLNLAIFSCFLTISEGDRGGIVDKYPPLSPSEIEKKRKKQEIFRNYGKFLKRK